MNDWITFALPKGRILEDSMELFAHIGITCPEMSEKSRKLVFENPEQKFRFMAV
ncbi:MAG: ATP phosphoribosyltransferase, partial [Desulfuromonadales bacterium]|nr:ATP phosphoribosyltransferase [Desulfuromonadales bacterium]